MKNLRLSAYYSCFFLTGLSVILVITISQAQQTLFNVPSADITPKNKPFYQHQLNFYSIEGMESNSHIVFGLGKNWDVGINLVDLSFHFDQQPLVLSNETIKPLYPLLMASAQKQWELKKDYLSLTAGTQVGPNVGRLSKVQVAMMNYTLVRWQFTKSGYIIGGPFHTNDVFVGGRQNQYCLMFGFEYRLNNRWIIMSDFISGQHEKSKTVIGGGCNLTEKLQVFLGSLLAFPNQALKNGVILEINWYSWDYKKH